MQIYFHCGRKIRLEIIYLYNHKAVDSPIMIFYVKMKAIFKFTTNLLKAKYFITELKS